MLYLIRQIYCVKILQQIKKGTVMVLNWEET